jgi:hypothetical protein
MTGEPYETEAICICIPLEKRGSQMVNYFLQLCFFFCSLFLSDMILEGLVNICQSICNSYICYCVYTIRI